MAKKKEEIIVSGATPVVQSQAMGLLPIIGLVVIGSMMYRSGYNLGLRVSKQVLKRHDKDVRKMEKRVKNHYKDYDLVKKQKPEKKWFFW